MVAVRFPEQFYHIFVVMRPLVLVFLPLLLAGCTMDVKRLHDLNPPANDFASSLASEYSAYADSEVEQGRRWSGEHFAEKGLHALDGKDVEPDPVDTSLSKADQEELTDARTQLMKALTDDTKRASPQQAARAQLLFDCWQHEIAKRIDQTQSPCGDEFHSTFAQLQEVADSLTYGKTISHTIIFSPKSTKLDAQSRASIKEVAGTLSVLHNYRVQLDAYMGILASQRKLTEARVLAVRRALIEEGVNEHVIHTHKKRGGKKAVLLGGEKLAVDTKKITITIKFHSQNGGH